VDNVHHTPPSSFPSHNYWDNRDQFVPRLADVLATAATAQPDLTECSSTNATREAHRRSSAQSCS
jgi:hypothetical protein